MVLYGQTKRKNINLWSSWICEALLTFLKWWRCELLKGYDHFWLRRRRKAAEAMTAVTPTTRNHFWLRRRRKAAEAMAAVTPTTRRTSTTEASPRRTWNIMRNDKEWIRIWLHFDMDLDPDPGVSKIDKNYYQIMNKILESYRSLIAETSNSISLCWSPFFKLGCRSAIRRNKSRKISALAALQNDNESTSLIMHKNKW